MRIEHSLNLNIAAGFTITLSIVIFIGVISYRSINAFIVSTEIVAQSHQIMTTIEATLGDIVTAESEARGYIITGNEHYLNLYRTALDEVENDFSALHSIVMDESVQRQVADLERLAHTRLTRLKGTVTTRKLDGLEAVQESSGTGKQLMDELRQKIAVINVLETNLLNERDQAAQALAGYTIKAMIAGIVFAVILAFVSVTIFARDIAQREKLEGEILAISEREQRRIGQDLHDGVCQQLTGTALLSRSLQMKLAAKSVPESGEAMRITTLINDTIEQTRRVTRGLHPVVDEPIGLMQALQELTSIVHDLGTVACRFDCPTPVPIPNQAAATHLYRIAQEAVQNAIRHAHPSTIVISLNSDEHILSLVITDDGCGLPAQRASKGMGLAIMNYRAHTIGATLKISPGEARGTVVTCTLPQS